MSWKDNSAHIKIRRRFQCDECRNFFDDRVDSAEAPVPDCPVCSRAGVQPATAPAWVPPMPAIGTTKGRAIDLAQKMAEEDYGLTNMRDNQRPGDIAFMPDAPKSTAEQEQDLRTLMQMEAQMGPGAPLPQGPLAPDGTRQLLVDPALQAQEYWHGAQGGAAEQTVATLAASKPASEAARAQGAEVSGILETARNNGSMDMKFNVVAKAEAKELTQAAGG